MLKHIDKNALAEAIRRHCSYETEASSRMCAEEVCRTVDEKFEPLVEAWIRGEEFPVIHAGKYTVGKIMTIRQDKNFLRALLLLNLYHVSPAEGEREIWRPDGAMSPQCLR